MEFLVLSALLAVASSAQIPTHANGAARAAQLIAGKGASPVAVSDLAIHPVNYWNAGLQAAGLPYDLVGHSNGAVVPAESVAVAGVHATHLAVVQNIEDAEAKSLAIHVAAVKAKKDAKAREHAAKLAAIQAKKDAEARERAAHLAKIQAIKDAHAEARAAHFTAVKAAKANPSSVATKPVDMTNNNGAARAAHLFAGKGALPVAVSDLAIHPVNYWNAGLQASGLPYELVGHSNGAVVPAESVAVAGARATHLAVVQAIEDAEAEALAIHLAAVQAKKDAKARERAAQLAAIQAKKDAEARERAANFAKIQAIKDAHAKARAAHFAAVKAATLAIQK